MPIGTLSPLPPISPISPIAPLKPLKPLTGGSTPQGGASPGPAGNGAIGGGVAADDGEFIAAWSPTHRVVNYRRQDGTVLEKSGGSRSWRNFNSGNIISGSFAEANGSIGSDGVMAIFPSREIGRKAIETLLRGPSYRDLTIRDAIFRYAPPNENDSNGYVSFVSQETGLPHNTVLSTLLIGDLRRIVAAIEKMEGWESGEVKDSRVIQPPTGAIVSAAVVAHEWMKIAEREAALPEYDRTEWPDSGPLGHRENPRILDYLNSCDFYASDPAESDEINWCAGFVNYCLENAGFVGNEHPGARSVFWNRMNQFVRLDQPAYGAIAVLRDAPFDDADWDTGTGHVGFIVDSDSDGLLLLGGNQSNTVKRSYYKLPVKDGNGNTTRRLEAIMMPRMN